MLRISHPRPERGRQSFIGVDFIDGVTVVESLHPERELALRQHGFIVERVPEFVDLTTLSKRELLDIAATEGVEVPHRATRTEIIDLLASQPAAPIDDPLAIQEG